MHGANHFIYLLARKNISLAEADQGVQLRGINHHFTSHFNAADRILLTFEDVDGETDVFTIRANRYLLRINLELNIASIEVI